MFVQCGYYEDYYIEQYGDQVNILDYVGDEAELRLPQIIEGYEVVTIEKYAFNKIGSRLRRCEVPVGCIIREEAFPDDVQIDRYFTADMEGFEFNGTWIVDPYLDETGRFSVDPHTYYQVKVIEEAYLQD